MNFTKEQFEKLSKFEENFRTAIRSNWSRGVTSSDAQTIHAILTEAIKPRVPARLNPTCGVCVLRLLKHAGKLYFEDKEVLERQAAEATAEPKPAKAVRKTPARGKAAKTEVKTKKSE